MQRGSNVIPLLMLYFRCNKQKACLEFAFKLELPGRSGVGEEQEVSLPQSLLCILRAVRCTLNGTITKCVTPCETVTATRRHVSFQGTAGPQGAIGPPGEKVRDDADICASQANYLHVKCICLQLRWWLFHVPSYCANCTAGAELKSMRVPQTIVSGPIRYLQR